MNTVKQALEMAIEAIDGEVDHHYMIDALFACKSALAELESVEPVYYGILETGTVIDVCDTYEDSNSNLQSLIKHDRDYASATIIELYTSPQTREWVGLTNEQIYETVGDGVMDIALAIEDKLKQLNTKG